MSGFYADISGSRGLASRQGTTQSGISSHARGWNIGACVFCYADDGNDDVVRVSITGGSSGGPSRIIFEGGRVPEMSLADMVYRALDSAGAIQEGVICTTPEQLEEIIGFTGYR